VKTKIDFIDYSYGSIWKWLSLGENNELKSANFSKARSVPILLYHGVIEDPNWKPDEVSIRLNDFKNQMFALKKSGYQTIKLEDYLKFSRGEKELPEKSFLLTFDDGRKDSYYQADPILRTLGYTAVMNVITSRSLGPDNEKSSFHLSETELQKMVVSGRWELESHGKDDHDLQMISSDGTQGHFLTNKLWLKNENQMETDEEFKKRIIDDLLESKKDLENDLNIKVIAFAYPFGDFGQASQNFPQGQEILQKIASIIYPLSFTQLSSGDFPTNYPENSPVAKRITITSAINPEDLLVLLESERDKALDWKDNFEENHGWLKGWGSVKFQDNSMIIGDSANDDSGSEFLAGSYLWKNYSLEARIKVENGTAFTFASRYKNAKNYASCNFYPNRVVFTQELNNMDQPEIETMSETNIEKGIEIQAGMQVKDNYANCFLNGKKIVSGKIDPSLGNGGIAFKIWDTIEKGSRMTIKHLSVSKDPLLFTNP